ncbi:MAG: hypothetical protein JWN48_1253 [Myxococcaceae bacterium]|nr:hypothetical protein [Myxococcaceae bacterium]
MENQDNDATARVFRALERGELKAAELSARQVCAFLGYTTGHLYHHFGSLDGLLCRVAQYAFERFGARLIAAGGALRDGPAMAEAFVEFGLAHPLLYGLMFDRHYDWAALHARGLVGPAAPSVQLWKTLVAEISARGTKRPEDDARVLFAGLHGLVSVARSGRANIGALELTDREAAIAAARRLAELILPGARAKKQKQTLRATKRAR